MSFVEYVPEEQNTNWKHQNQKFGKQGVTTTAQPALQKQPMPAV